MKSKERAAKQIEREQRARINPTEKNIRTQSSIQKILSQLKTEGTTPAEEMSPLEDEDLPLPPPSPTFSPLSKLKKRKKEFDGFTY